MDAQLVTVESDEEQVFLMGSSSWDWARSLNVKAMVGKKVFLVKGCLLHLERGLCGNEGT